MFNHEIADYLTTTTETWSEIVDYQALKLFDVKIFDYLITPLKWTEYKPSLIKQQLRISYGDN